MARPEAVKKLLFYPTPDEILQIISRYLDIPSHNVSMYNDKSDWLDPCAGEGALARLYMHMYQGAGYAQQERLEKIVRLHGVEIDKARADKTRKSGIRTIHAGYEDVHIAPSTISLAFCNPPYNSSMGGRMEHDFLKRVTGHLMDDGVLVYIVARQYLAPSARWLGQYYTNVRIMEFKPGVDDRFGQVVLFANKLAYRDLPHPQLQQQTENALHQYATGEVEHKELPTEFQMSYEPGYIPMHLRYDLPVVSTNKRLQFRKRTYDIPAAILQAQNGTGVAHRIGKSFEPDEKLGSIEMLTPPREDQIKILAAAGLAHNDIIEASDGHNHLLKCTTTKKLEEVQDADEKTYRETAHTSYCYFDMEDGKYTVLNQVKNDDSNSSNTDLNNYIANNAEAFTEMVLRNIEQVCDIPEYDRLQPLPLELAGKMRAYGKQMQAINLAVESLKRNRFAILGVQLGGGKTIMSVSANNLDGNTSTLVAAPATITTKWAAELNEFYNPNYSKPSIVRIDTATINTLKMPQGFPQPTTWPEMISQAFPHGEIKFTWLTPRKGALEVDLSNYPGVSYNLHREPKINGKSILGRLNKLLRFPHIEVRDGRLILSHDWNPVDSKNLPHLRMVLPPHAHPYILDSETYRIEYDKNTHGIGEKNSRAFSEVKRKLTRAIPGSKWAWIDHHTIDGMRRRPVSHTPTIYLMEQAKKLAKKATLETPHFTIISHSMLQGSYEVMPSFIGQEHPERHESTPAPKFFKRVFKSTKEIQVENDETGDTDTERQDMGLAKMPSFVAGWDDSTREYIGITCPECYMPLYEKKEDVPKIVTTTDTLTRSNPKKFREWLLKVTVKKRATCYFCNGKMYAPHAMKRNGHPNKKLSVDVYLKQRMRDVYQMLIFDEVQKSKEGDTAIGQSTGVVMNVIPKTMVLTGTLMNGYPKSLFHILWRLNPKFREEYTLEDADDFNRDMGFVEIQYADDKEDIDEYSMYSKRFTQHDKVRQLPGFMPQMFKWILPHLVLLKVPDIAEMPELTEHVIKVSLPEKLQKTYSKLMEDYDKEIDNARESRVGRMIAQLRSAMYQSSCSYPDAPYLGIDEHYDWYDSRSETTITAHIEAPVASVEEITPKEQALIDLVKKEREEGRRVLVYAQFTGTRDFINPPGAPSSLQRRLETAGLKVAFMRATDSSPTQRIYKVNQYVSDDIDVLICNPKLVEVGVNLLEFPTIVYYQITQETATMEQSQGRSWRIGQTQPVKIYYMLYTNTGQEVAMALLANKITVSQMMQGRMLTEGIGQLVVTRHDAMLLMARAISERLQMSQVIRTAGEVESLMVQHYDKFVGPHAQNMAIDQDLWEEYDSEHLSRARAGFNPNGIIDIAPKPKPVEKPKPLPAPKLVPSVEWETPEEEIEIEEGTQMSLFDMIAAV